MVSSAPRLMKFLMDGQQLRMLSKDAEPGTEHIPSTNSMSIPPISRMHMPESVPVITSDERIFSQLPSHKDSLCVEPLGRIMQIETGRDLTNSDIGMFAGFCALIGVLIIMPPMKGL